MSNLGYTKEALTVCEEIKKEIECLEIYINKMDTIDDYLHSEEILDIFGTIKSNIEISLQDVNKNILKWRRGLNMTELDRICVAIEMFYDPESPDAPPPKSIDPYPIPDDPYPDSEACDI